MPSNRKLTIRKTLTFLCILALFCSSCAVDGKMSMKIINMSTNDISNLSILYKGGDHKYSFLRKGENISLLITPVGESSITIVYEDDAEEYTKDIDVYIAPGYSGNIEVIIHANGNISPKTDLNVY